MAQGGLSPPKSPPPLIYVHVTTIIYKREFISVKCSTFIIAQKP